VGARAGEHSILQAMSAAPSQIIDSNGWRAELQLAFERRGRRTVLANRKHIGPLVVQRAFYPEGDVCHLYVVQPPGGIVGGDRLHLTAQLAPNSHALITTPAATKFYRAAPGKAAHMRQELQTERAKLEWLPQETILFREAQASMATVVRIDRQSRFIGWELCCYGRPASHELFDAGSAQQSFEVWIDGCPTLLDHLRIDAGPGMNAAWGLAGNTLLGTLLAYPANADDLEAARSCEQVAATLVDNVLSCRLVGNDSDSVKQAMIQLWRILRPRIVGREAVLPRIWAT
jgi:urease accessory protein